MLRRSLLRAPNNFRTGIQSHVQLRTYSSKPIAPKYIDRSTSKAIWYSGAAGITVVLYLFSQRKKYFIKADTPPPPSSPISSLKENLEVKTSIPHVDPKTIIENKAHEAEESSHTEEEGKGNDEEELKSSAAFDPETGEINWDCPCLGGMADGPCGEEFKKAFSCFVYSEADPKGMDCIDAFKGMQECFRQHPDVYGEEIDDDEDDNEKGVDKHSEQIKNDDDEEEKKVDNQSGEIKKDDDDEKGIDQHSEEIKKDSEQ